eukprot:TRINITY_DN2386_c0_g2_i1.p1 TRINITY_DN2386_c0_g2~~TRINITY_DN2386_c0_g2_i1.p1  ORF type:complete len:684 (-),score=141.71 TRINITY_DN2386_c0_g2_i1:687-2738(-)
MSENQYNGFPEIRQDNINEEDSVATFVSDNNFGKLLRKRSQSVQRDKVEGAVIDYIPIISKLSLNSANAAEEIKNLAIQEDVTDSNFQTTSSAGVDETIDQTENTETMMQPSRNKLEDGIQDQYQQEEVQQNESNEEVIQQQQDVSGNLETIGNQGDAEKDGAMTPVSTMSDVSNTTSLVNMSSLSSSRVRIICETGGELALQMSGKFDYVGGERRLVSVEMIASLQYLKSSIEKQLELQGLLEENCLKAFLPGSDDILLDLKNDMDVRNLWEDLLEYKSSVDAMYRLRLFVCPVESLMEGDDTAYHQSSSIGSPASDPTTPQSSTKKEVSFAELEAKLEIIEPDDVSIRRLLGSGAQGEVYLGTWQESDVAVKCLNTSTWSDSMYDESGVNEDAVRELVQEAAILGKLRHPNIVSIYGIVIPCQGTGPDKCAMERVSDDAVGIALDAANEVAASLSDTSTVQALQVRPPAIVEEYMGGGSLFASLKKRSELLFGKSGAYIRLKLARDAAKGMEYLHSKKIVHFDLKSGNLLLSKRDGKPHCKVADFSLSKQRNTTYVSNVSNQRGTLPWIAPEIIHTPDAVNEKVDVYSFGIVLWELWTGLEPYAGLNYHTLYHKLSSNRSTRPAFPGEDEWEGDNIEEPVSGYKQLIQDCWATNPSERLTFKEIIIKLEELLLQNIPSTQQ